MERRRIKYKVQLRGGRTVVVANANSRGGVRRITAQVSRISAVPTLAAERRNNLMDVAGKNSIPVENKIAAKNPPTIVSDVILINHKILIIRDYPLGGQPVETRIRHPLPNFESVIEDDDSSDASTVIDEDRPSPASSPELILGK